MTVTAKLQRPPGIHAQWNQKQYIHHWTYKTEHGSVVGHVVRYEGSERDKDVIPFFKLNGAQWTSGFAEGARPLFGLEVVSDANPGATIYVAEGEKAAQAALYLGLPCVTSPSGSNAAEKANWDALARFQSIVILPDNDEPGVEYASSVIDLLRSLPGDREVRLAEIRGIPKEGDLVDWVQQRVPDWDGYSPIPREPGDDLLVELLDEIKDVATVAVRCRSGKDSIEPVAIDDSESVADVAVSRGDASENLSVIPKAPEDIPYPLDSVGDLLSGAILAVQECVQAPLVLCAQSVLAAATHAVQAQADLCVDGRTIPLSEFFLTIAQSGERKSAVDKIVLKEHYRWQRNLQEQSIDQWTEFKAKQEASDKSRKNILKDNEDESQTVSKLLLLEQPQTPLQPILIPDDITLEGLQKLLLVGQPSVFVANDEAGNLVGGHAFDPDHILKSLSGFSKLWDGTPMARVRSGDGASVLEGKRVTMHLQMQPIVGRELMSHRFTQGQGFLSRCLVACPESTAGTRFYRTVDPFADPRLYQFHDAIRASLERRSNLRSGTCNVLEPRTIGVSESAKQLYVQYYDHIESQLGLTGDYESVRGFANKAPEHALRLAGVITLLGDLEARDVGDLAMSSGIDLADFYLQSLLRVEDIPQVDPERVEADLIQRWMHEKDPERSRDWKARDIQNGGPGRIRSLIANEIRERLAILVEAGHLKTSGVGNKTSWRLL